MYEIIHDPSGDRAEAATFPSAEVAARTLLLDNDNEGVSRVYANICDDGRMIGRCEFSCEVVKRPTVTKPYPREEI